VGGQTPAAKFISREEAVRAALSQASDLSRAQIEESIAREDAFQAEMAFRPKVSANPGLIYTSPTLRAADPGIPRQPSYLGANAVSEYQGLLTVSGELDTSGKLRSERRRALALLDAAKLGTEAARRNLVNATEEAYFGLALATARRVAAEQILSSTREFESTTKLLVEGGEAAPVDLLRAQVQTSARGDDLAQAETEEKTAREALRAYIGGGVTEDFAVSDLQTLLPEPGELGGFNEDSIGSRPELAKLDAETLAADADAQAAKAERKPQFTYSVDGGFISDSLRPASLGNAAGVRVTVGVNVPLYDWGISRSRQTQAELKAKAAEDSKTFAERIYRSQFRSSLAQAGSAADRIRDLAGNVANSERILDVAIERYRAGETQIIEVTDAQAQIVALRSALLKAIYDYQIALSRLRMATGK
jgi:outer membrane protein TolC